MKVDSRSHVSNNILAENILPTINNDKIRKYEGYSNRPNFISRKTFFLKRIKKTVSWYG